MVSQIGETNQCSETISFSFHYKSSLYKFSRIKYPETSWFVTAVEVIKASKA